MDKRDIELRDGDPGKHGYVPDPLTWGPFPPEDWGVDAWVGRDGGYLLRAWNDASKERFMAHRYRYEDAHELLLRKIEAALG